MLIDRNLKDTAKCSCCGATRAELEKINEYSISQRPLSNFLMKLYSDDHLGKLIICSNCLASFQEKLVDEVLDPSNKDSKLRVLYNVQRRLLTQVRNERRDELMLDRMKVYFNERITKSLSHAAARQAEAVGCPLLTISQVEQTLDDAAFNIEYCDELGDRYTCVLDNKVITEDNIDKEFADMLETTQSAIARARILKNEKPDLKLVIVGIHVQIYQDGDISNPVCEQTLCIVAEDDTAADEIVIEEKIDADVGDSPIVDGKFRVL